MNRRGSLRWAGGPQVPVLTDRPTGGYRVESLCVPEHARQIRGWIAVGDPARQPPTRTILSTKRRPTTVRTYSPKPGDVQRQWHVIDATDVVLGRLATQTAILLRGKHKARYAPHVDTGDFVIVVNAEKVALTGSKREQKIDYRHSGRPGGLRTTTYAELLESNPRRVVEKAIKGMLPHNSLGRQMLSKLKVYAGPQHPHQAQQPVPYEITQVAQ